MKKKNGIENVENIRKYIKLEIRKPWIAKFHKYGIFGKKCIFFFNSD